MVEMEKQFLFRILFLADTHLGFDMPFRPRIERPRRGQDFFSNYESALKPAFDGGVDMVIHGGDLFFRTKIPARLVDMVMDPMFRLAGKGVPIFIVPGNHERSRIPINLWAGHENIHIFDKPTTYCHRFGQYQIALAGFPFIPKIRDQFKKLVQQTRYDEVYADLCLLCIHQVVEGAQVGAVNYTFRQGSEVIKGEDIPAGFEAVLAGHIHRAQILKRDLQQRPLKSPVIYPGSIERTSFAERDEAKGYIILTFDLSSSNSKLLDISNVWLPTRPMLKLSIDVSGMSEMEIKRLIRYRLQKVSPNSFVRIDLKNSRARESTVYIPMAELRELAPPGVIISTRVPRSILGMHPPLSAHPRQLLLE